VLDDKRESDFVFLPVEGPVTNQRTAVPVLAKDALEATKIAAALTESFRRGKPIFFDEEGEAVLD
jgi:hypothetical protein